MVGIELGAPEGDVVGVLVVGEEVGLCDAHVPHKKGHKSLTTVLVHSDGVQNPPKLSSIPNCSSVHGKSCNLLGEIVGDKEVGAAEGRALGVPVGCRLGLFEGPFEGERVGEVLGICEGAIDGCCDGCEVTHTPHLIGQAFLTD